VKRIALGFIILTIAVMMFASFLGNIKLAAADNTQNYIIQHVDHCVQVLSNGYFFINDTIRTVGNASQGTTLANFNMGFPFGYGPHVVSCIAYDDTGFFNVTLNVPLEDRTGFYGVEVSFPNPLDISVGATHTFTVVFVLSNNLLTSLGTNSYNMDFPAYPSFTKTVDDCNASLAFPTNASSVTILKDDGTVNGDSYELTDLPAFTYAPANATFSVSGEKLQLFDVITLGRVLSVSGTGDIGGSDSYYVTNEAPTSMAVIEVQLPPNATSVTAHDQFGREFANPPTLIQDNETTDLYRVAFTLPLESNKSSRFTVAYQLPSEVYVNAMEASNTFNVTFPLFQHVNYYVEQASITLTLPEGARILNVGDTLGSTGYGISRNVFQDTITVDKEGVSPLEDIMSSGNVLQVVYQYNPLWLSFRPALWMWAVAIVVGAVVFVWKRPKAAAPIGAAVAVVRLNPEHIRAFVDAYEEKRKIAKESESLETMVQKGRIPRRRYKVRKKTLEARLSTLSATLAEHKERMHAAGGKYADLMRQLEVAETEIDEVETNIKSIEARHGRGEISLGAHRKLLGDYERRKSAAETAISGILLRLREEIR
jgi:hypothetical protein